MGSDSFLAVACAGLIGLVFGMALTFAGYRLFYFLLPIWGFVFGLAFGAHTLQALIGEAFLATVTSWIVGFVVGLIFAALSYLFWSAAVVVVAGALGYSLTAGLLGWLGMDLGFVVWLIAVAVGVIIAGAALVLNLQKWVVIIATSVLGAGAVVGTFVLMFNPSADALREPVKHALQTSTLLSLLFMALALAGIVVQHRSTKRYIVASYNRWEEWDAAESL